MEMPHNPKTVEATLVQAGVSRELREEIGQIAESVETLERYLIQVIGGGDRLLNPTFLEILAQYEERIGTMVRAGQKSNQLVNA